MYGHITYDPDADDTQIIDDMRNIIDGQRKYPEKNGRLGTIITC